MRYVTALRLRRSCRERKQHEDQGSAFTRNLLARLQGQTPYWNSASASEIGSSQQWLRVLRPQ
jgi:hypothetical protein